MAVSVRIDEATPVTGGLLLDMLTEPEKGERPNRRNRGRTGGPPNGKRSGRPWKKGRRG